MTTAFQSNAFQTAVLAFQIDQTPPPVVTTEKPGGGDSTRLKKKGRRPKYFWEKALEDRNRDQLAEAAFDVVADAYLIENHRAFEDQVNYIRNIERMVARHQEFAHISEQLQTALKDLEYRAEMRSLLMKAQEESELRELLEII